MNPDYDILGLFIAALGGFAVGLEREWSKHARFAGLRTFTLLGGLGGLAGLMWTAGLMPLATVVIAGAAGVIAVGYIATSREDPDGTTHVAALVVVAAGVLAGLGAHQTACGVVAVTSLLLLEKTRLHNWVARIDAIGLRAGMYFAVMALVIMPLLPKGPFGPLGGIQPRQLWTLVLFFSGLSFVAYIARQIVAPGRGYLVTGALGGLISSTNVTFTFARMSRSDPSTARELAFGAIAANAMLYPRVLLATAVLNAAIAPRLAPYLIAPFLIAAIVTFIGLRTAKKAEDRSAPLPANPLQLGAALQMALLFLVVSMIVYFAREYWGQAGVLGSAAVLGLTDVDALVATMTRGLQGTTTPAIAGMAIALGAVSNTFLKMSLALLIGRGAFRKIAAGTLALMLAAGAASLLLPR